MKFASILSLVIGLATASEVFDITKDTYDEFVKSNDLFLGEFFAPWCGHCKALAPEYEKAAEQLKEKGIKLMKVDCTVETDICSDLDVKGYPTLKIFRDGKPTEYKGQRTADSIVETMIKQSLPALSELKKDEVKEFSESNKVVVVGFFEKAEGEEYTTYEKLANTHRDDYVFGFTTDADEAKALDATPPQVVLFKQFDEKRNNYEGSLTSSDDLLEFFKENSVPLMDELGPENYGLYIERGLPITFMFYENKEQKEKLTGLCEEYAKEHKGKLSFAFIDAVKYGGHAKTLNLKEEWPAIGIQDTTKHTKFPFEQTKELTAENLKEYFAGVVDGTLEPSLKSEPIPEENDGPVKVIVGKNFDEIVMNKEHDVFLEVYAPWCGHCKKLAPVWDELGEHVKGSKVVIAKMDGTENDIPPSAGFQVEGFPTLKLFKANDNEIVDYEGDRTLESLNDFLKKNAVHSDSFDEMAPPKEDDELELDLDDAGEDGDDDVGDADDDKEEHDEL